MSNNEYTCAVCHKTFKKGWSDEEALQELNENFGDCKQDNCSIVCDDCFKIMQIMYPFSKFKKDSKK